MEITVIASGSNGNCYLVENKESSVIIDAGKSVREIEFRLNKVGKNLENLDGVVLSHSHIDHFLSVGAISRKYKVPVYMANEVYEECNGRIGNTNIKKFSVENSFKIKSMEIKPIRTSHDVFSCGFVIGKLGIFTDTGIVTPEILKAITNLNSVLIESNHDIDMLLNGHYPAFLKQRILSEKGHLSNIDASLCIQNEGKNLNLALLGHLSENNNTPNKAKETFETLVKRKIENHILSRDKESGCWKL